MTTRLSKELIQSISERRLHALVYEYHVWSCGIADIVRSEEYVYFSGPDNYCGVTEYAKYIRTGDKSHLRWDCAWMRPIRVRI